MKSFTLLSIITLTGLVAAHDNSAYSAPQEVQDTCPAEYKPTCNFVCGQKSINYWYCSKKNIFPDPTDDNWCTPCPRGPSKVGSYASSTLRPTATTTASETKRTCPARYDAKCGFICGQKSIDFWYCSESNIFPDPTDDNWCTPCPGGPDVPGNYGPAPVPQNTTTAGRPSQTSVVPPPAYTGAATSIEVDFAALVGFLGFLLAF